MASGPGGRGQSETHDGRYPGAKGSAPGKVVKGSTGGSGSAAVIAAVNKKATVGERGQNR